MKVWMGLIAGAVLGVGPAMAQDLAAGEGLYDGACRNCHGPAAKGMASFPKLSDKDADYLVMRLEQYRAGERVGANTALMAPHAADLTDEDIANVAAYIVSLSG